MLNLKTPSKNRWLAQLTVHLDQMLIDHAHCEKKAAAVALNLMFAYTDNVELCRELSEIVIEETQHYQMVLDLLDTAVDPFPPAAARHVRPQAERAGSQK